MVNLKEALITGGYILLSRKIIESEIFKKPPLYLKVWIYLLSAAQHSQYKNLNRGQLFTSIPEIQEACSHYIGFRKQIPSKDKIFNILQWLRRVCEHGCEHDDEHDTNTTMITTTRATQGILVNVERYSFYQDPQNYKYNDECDNEEATNTTTKKLRTQRDPDNINKNVEECQEEKNDNNVKNERKTIIAPIVPYQEIMDSFNDICVSLPKLQLLTETRKTTIKTRYKELHFSVDEFKSFFRTVEESDFLTGRKMDFKASFDWITKSANFVKIREGNYVNKEGGINYGKPTNNNGKNVFKDEDLPNQTILR